MLKSVLITSSTSGLVLYQKEWVVLVEGKVSMNSPLRTCTRQVRAKLRFSVD